MKMFINILLILVYLWLSQECFHFHKQISPSAMGVYVHTYVHSTLRFGWRKFMRGRILILDTIYLSPGQDFGYRFEFMRRVKVSRLGPACHSVMSRQALTPPDH
jgi:hypothetical protein